MFPQILTTAWLTVFYWNNVSSQLLYENDRWNNELFRDSKEASKQYSQEKLEALLKEARLDSDIWRSRHELLFKLWTAKSYVLPILHGSVKMYKQYCK